MSEERKSLQDLIPNLQPTKIDWTPDIRKSLISLLVKDRSFFATHKDHLSPDFFKDPAHASLFLIVSGYFEEFSNVPSMSVVQQEMYAYWERQRSEWPVVENEMYAVYDHDDAIMDKDWLDKKLTAFCKREAYKKALSEAFDVIGDDSRDDLDVETSVEKILRSAMAVGVPEQDVADYFDDFEGRYEQMKEQQDSGKVEKFPSGFPSIDYEMEGGANRKEVFVYLADSGVGKSFALVHTGVENIFQGKRVLYVTLELSKEVVQKRFDSCFTEVAMRDLVSRADNKTLIQLRELRKIYKNRLKVFEFEEGTVGVPEIRAAVEKHYIRTGWQPDIVIIDYLDEMKRPSVAKDDYDGQGMNLRSFRGWMKTCDMCGYTATQANRDANTSKYTGRHQIGDSYWKLRLSDYMVSMSVSDEEKVRKIMRLFFVKNRNGKDGFPVYCERDLSHAHLKEISEKDYEQRLQAPPPKET